MSEISLPSGNAAFADASRSTVVSTAPSRTPSFSAKERKTSPASIAPEVSGFEADLRTYQAALGARGIPPTRDLSLAWDHLSIRGIGGADDVVFAPDLGSIFMPWTVAKQKKRTERLAAALREKQPAPDADAMNYQKGMPVPKKGEPGLRKGERYLLKDFSGLLKPGEMMLVVGRPGSGCTTFLKSLAGLTSSYAGKEGGVYYGALEAGSKAMRPLRGDVSFNSEEDLHDPNLLVGRTMDFALRNETPAAAARPLGADGKPISAKEYQEKTKLDLLRAFGIEHTLNTKVGDQYVRGVSGGERKRVSLAEVLTTNAQIQCWDNATRGLDASTALGFARVCRTLCDVTNRINVVSLYQAGNGIYDLFDKVTVIAEGRLLYYGPRAEARAYFEALGFEHMEGANTADYLTAVTALNERQIIPGFEGRVPSTPAEFARIYQNSDVARRMRAEVDAYLADTARRDAETASAREWDALVKEKGTIKSLPQKVSFLSQIKAAAIKDAQQRWGDQWSLWARQATTLIQALFNGSVYYAIPKTTAGLFLRGGLMFMLVLFPVILSFADVQSAFVGRSVLAKHKAYSMYRAGAVLAAQTLVDLPIFFVQIFLYVLVSYFMAKLKMDGGLFWIAFLFSWLSALSMTTLFRTIGYAFNTYNDASKISGTVFTLFVLYGGFVVYQPSMHPWFSWIRWLNPTYYALEPLLSGELENLDLQCSPPQLAPYGPGYEGGPQSCAIVGSTPDSTIVSGTVYVHEALEFFTSHRWRNFGIMIALWFGFLVLGMIFLERLPAAGSTQGVTLYKRGGGGAFIKAAEKNGTLPRDEEEGGEAAVTSEKPHGGAGTGAGAGDTETIASGGTTFTWKDINYTVRHEGKDLQLLRNVSGYCKAGTITALMGSSGAGKTTLMDVLAARKSEGEITGEVLLNGSPLPLSFQRTTGYCEQLDVHLPQSTVREALEFSALLRQPRHYSDKEKLAYVDTIIELLELQDLEDAIIGVPGAGLGVEQRKRLTIGVELVARPTLLFLDEPTSGLDGQSSFLIVQFMQKLAAAGQSIVCVIHQPSAALFAGFDNLLLLKAGGRTVFFGAVKDVPDYFSRNGITWPKDVNPAEFMIDVVSGDLSKDRDWHEVWLSSPEREQMMRDIDIVNEEAAALATATDEDNHRFAASFWTQLRVVVHRCNVQLYRDTEYVINKFMLHIATGLIVGFTFWKIDNSYAGLKDKVFSIFQFVFVAPGVIVQTQPKFIANRDIFEKRERKSMLYSWKVFVLGEIIAEWPYLLICALLYWATWYPTSGFSLAAGAAGPVFLTMVLYEFLYTGMGQFIAAYAPNAVFAAMVLPLFISILVTFAGIMIPYPAITAFWRYWLYYLDPFTYLMQGLLTFPIWNEPVQCKSFEYGYLDPPAGQTCGQYFENFLQYATGYVNNPDATSNCEYCGYAKGSEYLASMNITRKIDGWQGVLITLLFVITSYAFVFLLLKLRSKATKTASK
ncbi:ABC transporter [Cutaneotrichosporon oleaginosum]|uniref:ABC transporter n=1 Tax=Cutaneotrichosporon oleaginosum TaxID=879819 RepID=A0A0J0XQG9_9TREE|nr:ABC transporter [Cutaneotrichosporon oleaginosum]KLT43360.1 ABC transporter [Cutaneotrichosporon oleaginosum]TXT05424.1 hypothetical protein COLE_06744 [Cutaneotrichosporon oleaginosum]